MSDAPDREQQTEDPSDKRTREAHERGDLPVSPEIGLAVSFLVLAALTGLVLGPAGGWLSARLGVIVERIDTLHLDTPDDMALLGVAISTTVLLFLVPFVMALGLSGISSGLAQTGFVIGWEKLAPSLERLSPRQGLARIFGSRARVDLLKAALKVVIGLVVISLWFRTEWSSLRGAATLEYQAVPELFLGGAMRLCLSLGLVHVVIAIADVFWVRVRWRLDHRMTKEDVKREAREAEIDPALKARMRALASARARRRMMAAVPSATVVIANPTHLAIALRFDRTRDIAPLVVAKGADLVALRIRERAAAHNVPIVEDRPLARAMFDLVELDRPIPQQFYKAIAIIIHHLSRRGVVRPARS